MSAVQKACYRPVFGHFFILVSKAYYYQHVTLCGNGIESQNQVDTAKLLGRWGSLTLVGSSFRGRKKKWFQTSALQPYPVSGKALGVYPQEKSRAGIPKAVHCWLQHRSGNSCNGTGATLYGLLPSLELHEWRGVGWGGGGGRPAAWATACLPYHLCPGLSPWETFQGADPWPLVTNVCHTHRVESLSKRNLKSYTIGQKQGTRPRWNQSWGN